MRFLNAKKLAPLGIFPPRRWWKPRGVNEALFAIRFFVTDLWSSKGKIIIYPRERNLARGELILSSTNIRLRALRCALALRPFLICRTIDADPIAKACTLLEIDKTNELTVFLSNTVLVFLGLKNGQLVVVHLATSPTGETRLGLHQHGLEMARDALLSSPISSILVPEAISAFGSANYQVFLQSRVPGIHHQLENVSDSDFYGAIDRALQPLLGLRATASDRAEGADFELIFNEFPLISQHWPALKEMVCLLLSKVQTWQRARGLVPVLTHGDYWIRNMLFAESGEVTGIIDWEWSRRYGTPGVDALHLAFMTLVMERDHDITEYIEQTWTGRWESDFLAAYIAQVQDAFDLDTDDICHLAALLCLDDLNKLRNTNRSLTAERMEMFLSLRPAMESWIARSEAMAYPSALFRTDTASSQIELS